MTSNDEVTTAGKTGTQMMLYTYLLPNVPKAGRWVR